MAKRVFDFTMALLGLVVLSPLLLLIAIAVKLDSRGPVFYAGDRLGLGGKPFGMIKFRSMRPDADRIGPPAAGEDDARITRVGRILRMTKLDEVPQLINVLKGEMSLVGPRPEVAYFFDFYTEEEKAAIWSVRPGMTDYASIHFHDEDKLLAGAEDPVQAYLDLCRDKKVALQMKYIEERSLWDDLKVTLATLATVIGSRFSPSKG